MASRKLSQTSKNSRRGEFVAAKFRIKPRTADILSAVSAVAGKFPGTILDDLVEHAFGHFIPNVSIDRLVAKSRVTALANLAEDQGDVDPKPVKKSHSTAPESDSSAKVAKILKHLSGSTPKKLSGCQRTTNRTHQIASRSILHPMVRISLDFPRTSQSLSVQLARLSVLPTPRASSMKFLGLTNPQKTMTPTTIAATETTPERKVIRMVLILEETPTFRKQFRNPQRRLGAVKNLGLSAIQAHSYQRYENHQIEITED